MPIAARMKGRRARAVGVVQALAGMFRARRDRRRVPSRVSWGLGDEDPTSVPALLDVARRQVRQARDTAVGALWCVGGGRVEPGLVDPPDVGTSSPAPGWLSIDCGGDVDPGGRTVPPTGGGRGATNRSSERDARGRAETTSPDPGENRHAESVTPPARLTLTRATPTRIRARVRVLGPPALLTPDGAPVGSLREAALEVLVFLVVHRDGASLEVIKEAVYGDATRARAAERLSTDVANLRNRIRHALAAGRGVNPVVNVGGWYRLDPGVVEVDWWDVEDALTQARSAGHDSERERALREAVGAFHGVLADGSDYAWAAAHREATRRAGIVVHTKLAGLIARIAPREAARLLAAACDLDPYDEDLACHAMRADARMGDFSAVQNRMRRLRAALADLDESPDSATEALVVQLTARRRPPGAGRRGDD